MAAAYPDPAYHDNYSEDESSAPSASRNGVQDEEESEEEEEEEEDDEDDFLPARRAAPSPDRQAEPAPKRRRISPQPQQATSRPPPPASSSQTMVLPEPSIINAEPLDEFMREIADWILRVAGTRTNIEIEAKIGILVDSRTGARLHLPVLSETILTPDYPDLRFESNIALSQHAHFNTLLNSLVSQSAASSYPHAQIAYSHTKVIDSFHASSGKDKIRVTTDEKTGKIKESVVKSRLADLNIYSPKRKVDWRISVNVETPAPPPAGQATHSRRKDRMTYTHQAFQVDLTQVTPSTSGPLLHELEVEFRDTSELLRLGGMRMEQRPEGDAYDELVRVFVNNVHILVRNVL